MPGLALLSLLAVVGAILALIKISRIESRIRDLERRLDVGASDHRSLLDRVLALEDALSPPSRAKSAAPKPSPRLTVVEPSLMPEPHHVSPVPPPIPVAPAPPSRTREEWESFVGGKLLNRIGALALIIGLGFFLKYAFDNNWISETVRVLIGAFVGLACLAGAYRTHQRGFQIFAQGLVGAGIAILYLSVYASFNYYTLLPQWLAFVLMSIVTILALGQGFLYNSLATALLGCAGGLLTPLMLSTGAVNEVGLFTYLALLNVGLLASVIQKPSWNSIEPITLAGTWIYYASWYEAAYTVDSFATTLFFVGLFWLLFFAADVLRLAAMRLPATATQHPTGVIATLAAFTSLYLLLDHAHQAWAGTAVLLLAAPYAAAAISVRRRHGPDRFAETRLTATAVALLVTATAIEFSGFTTIRWWAAEAAVLMLLGVTRRSPILWRSAPAVLLLAVFKFIGSDWAFSAPLAEPFIFLWNIRSATLLTLIGSSAACGVILRATASSQAPERRWLIPALDVTAAIALFALVTVEVTDFFTHAAIDQPQAVEAFLFFLRLLTVAVAWGAIAVMLAELGRRFGAEELTATAVMIAALGIFVAVFRGISFEPISRFVPVVNARTGLMLGSLALTGLLMLQLRQPARFWGWCGRVLPVLGIGAVALVLSLLTGETLDYFNLRLDASDLSRESIETLTNLQQLSLSGVWLAASVALMAFGIWRGFRLQRIVAFVLFGVTITKIFLYDLSFLQTLYRIFSFIGLGVILLAVSYAFQRYKHLIIGPSDGARP